MPQLDVGIYFFQFFFIFVNFWVLYIFRIRFFLIKINKVIKHRIYKIKKIKKISLLDKKKIKFFEINFWIIKKNYKKEINNYLKKINDKFYFLINLILFFNFKNFLKINLKNIKISIVIKYNIINN